MEDARGRNGGGTTFLYNREHIGGVARSTRGNDGASYLGSDFFHKFHIITLCGSLLVNGSDEELSRTKSDESQCPFHRIKTGPHAPIVGKRLVSSIRHLFRLHMTDDALRAECPSGAGDKLRVFCRVSIDGDLIRARTEGTPNVFCGAHTAANGHGYKNITGRAGNNVQDVVAIIETRNAIYVEKLVGAFPIIFFGERLRVTDDTQALKLNPLYDIGAFNIEARYDTDHLIFLNGFYDIGRLSIRFVINAEHYFRKKAHHDQKNNDDKK